MKPLRDNIIATRDATLVKLADAHDYYTFTGRAWRSLQDLVEFEGRKFIYTNPATGTSIAEVALVTRAQRYVAEELATATLQQFVSIFEAFLSDVLHLWLIAYPRSLGRRQLSGDDILALPNKAAIVDALVSKELATVFYDRPANWFRYLNERVAIGCPTDAEALQFAEVKATRDVLVHGQGISNAQYVEKAGTLARAPISQRLNVPDPYHQVSWELLCKLTNDIGTGMAGKA